MIRITQEDINELYEAAADKDDWREAIALLRAIKHIAPEMADIAIRERDEVPAAEAVAA